MHRCRRLNRHEDGEEGAIAESMNVPQLMFSVVAAQVRRLASGSLVMDGDS